jgi:biotin carboxylase
LARLQDIAVAVAKNIGYVGAGTFEFLYDSERAWQVYLYGDEYSYSGGAYHHRANDLK